MPPPLSLETPAAPAGMPPKFAEGRRFAHYAGLGFLFAAAVHGLLFAASLVQNLPWVTIGWLVNPGAVIHLVAIAGCFACAVKVKVALIATIDLGATPRARSNALLLGILAAMWFIFGAALAIIPAILLAIAWVNLGSAAAETGGSVAPDASAPLPPDQWAQH